MTKETEKNCLFRYNFIRVMHDNREFYINVQTKITIKYHIILAHISFDLMFLNNERASEREKKREMKEKTHRKVLAEQETEVFSTCFKKSVCA